MSNLTIKSISAANQPGKLMDGDGLHLTVTQNQSKRWVHRYMFQGKRRDMGLGSYPTVPLADARLKRDQNKRLLAEGLDPIESAKVSKANAANASYRKFDDAAEQCIDALSVQWSNAKHRQQWTNTLRRPSKIAQIGRLPGLCRDVPDRFLAAVPKQILGVSNHRRNLWRISCTKSRVFGSNVGLRTNVLVQRISRPRQRGSWVHEIGFLLG